MKRIVVCLTVVGLGLAVTQPVWAQTFDPYSAAQLGVPVQYGAPVQYAAPPVQYAAPPVAVQAEQYPILKRVLIGAGVFGLGFAIGKATTPNYAPSYSYSPPVPPAPPVQAPVFRRGSFHHPVQAFHHGPIPGGGGPNHGPQGGPHHHR